MVSGGPAERYEGRGPGAARSKGVFEVVTVNWDSGRTPIDVGAALQALAEEFAIARDMGMTAFELHSSPWSSTGVGIR